MAGVDYSVLARASEIPALLQGFKNWCRWALMPNAGRPSKKPLCKPGDRSTFLPWDAVKNTPRNTEGGVGFHFLGGVKPFIDAQQGRLLGIDLDAVRDPVTGAIAPLAIEIIERLSGPLGLPFTEVSPSGTGLHVFVCVEREPPAGLRSKVRLMMDAMPNTGGKTPEIQIFGLGETAGYLCTTGNRLAATEEVVTCIESIDWLIDHFGLNVEERSEAKLPTGEGPSPTLNAISEKVREMPHGEALIAARWQEVTGEKSASEAFQRLIRLAVSAANGHGASVVQWLLTCTAWGRGEVEESADPMKYTRESWVERDVARACAKGVAVAPAAIAEAAFEVLPPVPALPPAEPSTGPKIESGDPEDVIDEWEEDGPLLCLPTGLETLDAMTGGGFPLGSRVFTIGAPNAGKTGLVLQLADEWLRRDVCVGFLGVDEEPVDVMVRIMQRRGTSREECEARSPELLAQARELVRKLPLRLWSGATTIEQAGVWLNAYARQRTGGSDPRPPCVLIVDSVQTARSTGEGDEESIHRAVTRRVAALRTAARRYRMLVVTTSEMSRAAYKHKRPEDQISEMAAAKESGAIEYSARILLSLRPVPGSSDVIELRVVKNKHGPEHRVDQEGIYLRLNRAAQLFAEDKGFEPVDPRDLEEAAKTEQRIEDMATLALVLQAKPLTVRGCLAAMHKEGVSHARTETARQNLIGAGAIVERYGEGKRQFQTLVPESLPPEVQEIMARRMVEGN